MKAYKKLSQVDVSSLIMSDVWFQCCCQIYSSNDMISVEEYSVPSI